MFYIVWKLSVICHISTMVMTKILFSFVNICALFFKINCHCILFPGIFPQMLSLLAQLLRNTALRSKGSLHKQSLILTSLHHVAFNIFYIFFFTFFFYIWYDTLYECECFDNFAVFFYIRGISSLHIKKCTCSCY